MSMLIMEDNCDNCGKVVYQTIGGNIYPGNIWCSQACKTEWDLNYSRMEAEHMRGYYEWLRAGKKVDAIVSGHLKE
jgi:endogenous inhibitor of DNA gyrase (YacG/DUF329 family)